MLFNTFDFAIFLPTVFIIYWFLIKRNLKLQNFFLLSASYFFYGWWDWRFLSLLIFSSLVDFGVGLGLLNQNNQTKRKILLFTSIIINLGILCFFKYFNFFIENFIAAFTLLGISIKGNTLNIILPVGISFYTFKTLSYTIDVYNKKLEPTKDLIAYLSFVSFFPQLLAGPIERAINLLPQLYSKRTFDYSKASDGLKQILWGLFKKVVIADNCAVYANTIFNNSTDYSGSTLFIGVLFFAFQVYCDFSGYSDMAIGIARLFGFDSMQNFAFPYFSSDIAEFWRRWHISLSNWLRDYIFLPLAYSSTRKVTRKKYLGIRSDKIVYSYAVTVTFLLCGLWHGANWTFVVWGLIFSFYLMLANCSKNGVNNLYNFLRMHKKSRTRKIIDVFITFHLVLFTWVFFRAENVGHALSYISKIFSTSIFTKPSFEGINNALVTIIIVLIFITIEWLGRERHYAISHFLLDKNRFLRWGFYAFLIFLIGMFMQTEETPFIYFQF
jgi:D-alanyl-lipoteichoic acid acyltransferase DltB (MBOAT superfamily)